MSEQEKKTEQVKKANQTKPVEKKQSRLKKLIKQNP